MEHRILGRDGDLVVGVPSLDGEALVVPGVTAVILEHPDRRRVLLQRRNRPGELVRGRLEAPGGKWRAGERFEEALRREVLEETGLEVIDIEATVEDHRLEPGWDWSGVTGAVVTIGHSGAYPALLVAVRCTAAGEPRQQEGSTEEPAWYLVEEVRELVEANPSGFTGPAVAALTALL